MALPGVGEALKREIAGLGLVVCCYGDLGGGLALGPVWQARCASAIKLSAGSALQSFD